MRSFIPRAAEAYRFLASLPNIGGKFTGKNAEQLPLADALRLQARMRRASKSGARLNIDDIIFNNVLMPVEQTTEAIVEVPAVTDVPAADESTP